MAAESFAGARRRALPQRAPDPHGASIGGGALAKRRSVCRNRSSAFPPAAKLGSIPRPSRSSCCVASHFHFICQHVCAGVAVIPTFLATTSPHVPRQEFQEGGVMQWKAQRPAHAGRAESRVRTNVFGRSGSSGWQEARSHCRRIATVREVQLAEPWFPHCVVVACQEEERVALEELHCRKHAPEKNELSPNS